MSEPAKTPSPFWTFSLRFYSMDGVPPACLKLQESAGADVNIMLFGLYAASLGRALSPGDVSAFIAFADAWKREVVAPLRQARVFLKEPPAHFDHEAALALRARVKAAELEAERLQQEALFARFALAEIGAKDARGAAARQNLDALAVALGRALDGGAVESLLAAFGTTWGGDK